MEHIPSIFFWMDDLIIPPGSASMGWSSGESEAQQEIETRVFGWYVQVKLDSKPKTEGVGKTVWTNKFERTSRILNPSHRVVKPIFDPSYHVSGEGEFIPGGETMKIYDFHSSISRSPWSPPQEFIVGRGSAKRTPPQGPSVQGYTNCPSPLAKIRSWKGISGKGDENHSSLSLLS